MDMDDVEQLDLTALGGTDTVTVDDMCGTDFRRAAIDLAGPVGGGDAAADRVIVNGSDDGDDVDVSTDGAQVTVSGLRTTTTISGADLIDQLRAERARRRRLDRRRRRRGRRDRHVRRSRCRRELTTSRRAPGLSPHRDANWHPMGAAAVGDRPDGTMTGCGVGPLPSVRARPCWWERAGTRGAARPSSAPTSASTATPSSPRHRPPTRSTTSSSCTARSAASRPWPSSRSGATSSSTTRRPAPSTREIPSRCNGSSRRPCAPRSR